MIYEIIRCRRKSIGIQLKSDGNLIVRAPMNLNDEEIVACVEKHKKWIDKHSKKIEDREKFEPLRFTKEQVKRYKEEAQEVLKKDCAEYGQIMAVTYNKVTIRDQKSIWGSCSMKKNISLCWRLILMPPKVRRYVVVHELAHCIHMNHSRSFWKEVEKIVPEYKDYLEWLRDNGYKYTYECMD